jgi:hypothetical protein
MVGGNLFSRHNLGPHEVGSNYYVNTPTDVQTNMRLSLLLHPPPISLHIDPIPLLLLFFFFLVVFANFSSFFLEHYFSLLSEL